MYLHLTARASYGLRPFVSPQVCGWAWVRLRALFPGALGAVLMPNHLHLIIPAGPDAKTTVPLAHCLAQLSSKLSLPPRTWEVAATSVVPDSKHLARQVRYVALNPCRDGLCKDPLEWKWSTYRGTLGAVADPWVRFDRLAGALGWESRGFRQRLHSYVSGDPSVHSEGTRFPVPAPSREFALVPLERVAQAAIAATEAEPGAIRRRHRARTLFVLLAWHQGWRDAALVARYAQVDRKTLYPKLKGRSDDLLAAGALCLGDDRLRDAERKYPADSRS